MGFIALTFLAWIVGSGRLGLYLGFLTRQALAGTVVPASQQTAGVNDNALTPGQQTQYVAPFDVGSFLTGFGVPFRGAGGAVPGATGGM